MVYANFTLPSLIQQFGLKIDETTDLFQQIVPVSLRPEFATQLARIVPLAVRVSTEKARSEFLIAPILAELWLLNDQQIGVLSGVEFDVDETAGLTGYCDYIVTGSAELLFVRSPILMMVEAKNEDMKRGYAQCIAEMIAAQKFNARDEHLLNEKRSNQISSEPVDTNTIYGVVTIGEKWKFMQLEGSTVRIDARDYYISELEKVFAILLYITRRRL